ncbi:MAG: ribosome recycling factor [Desulfovibrio sp. S3730MH75]|nr:MAG: ribosome recycling factor [Desulfovibrio sp. S3730MH75]
MMINAVIDDGTKRMDGALTSLEGDFVRLRTGRASTGLIDHIMVDYYGTPTPINQVASVAVPDSRTITIQPWDKGAFALIDKALLKSDLGLNPVNDGKLIRICIPPLTEERRKDLGKIAKKFTEDSKVALRNVRRDMNETLKKLEKDKDISSDEMHDAQDRVQKLTDVYVKKCEELLAAKDKEIMEI